MRHFRTAVIAAAAGILTACSESSHPTALSPEDVRPTLQRFNCVASVIAQTVSCDPATDIRNGDTRQTLQTIGQQGILVRITSSNVAYVSGTGAFSFNVTVQNLTDASFATANGSTRDAGGVRIFFHSGPTVTGGSGIISVANPTGIATFTAGGQPYFQYGGDIAAAPQSDLGAEGILAPAEISAAKPWQLTVPSTVSTFAFQLLVSTETNLPTLTSQAPQVASLDMDTLYVGDTVTVQGTNFHATPASNTVKVGGQTATVLSGNTTQLSFIVPCVGTGTAPVTITQSNMTSNGYTAKTKVPVSKVRSLGVGESLILTQAADAPCNEIASTGGPSKFIVALYSINTSPTSNAATTNYVFSGDPLGDLATSVTADNELQVPAVAAGRGLDFLSASTLADQRHYELMEKNREAYARLRAHFAGDRRMRYNLGVAADPVAPPVNATFRMSNINSGSICNSWYNINARRVYYNGKIAIYEDADSTASAFRADSNAVMQTYYNKIGEQFNADMEPVIRNNFGDVLRRDAVTDNNGVLIALFTPQINTKFPGIAGFVVSCDQYPRDSAGAFGTSNFGEFFYAYQPSVVGTGYSSGNTPDQWYRTIRSTFIHETKHVASMAARVANLTGNFEVGWLEEGSARMSEEMWAREAVYAPMAWRGNHGYGSAVDPRNVYCDVRPTGSSECNTNTRAPVSIMQRHFSSQGNYVFSQNARLLSPFGPTQSDNAVYYYAASWSLIRYAIDQYGTSDAAFLTSLTQSANTGATNLTTVAGVSLAQLLGGWALQYAVDDYPGLANPAVVTQNRTWNLRNIYAGYNTDFPSSWTTPYPLAPIAVPFGNFTGTTVTTLRGGGIQWYEFSGTMTSNQLLRLQAASGAAASSDIRIAIARVQ